MSNGHAFVGVSLVSVACSLGMLIDVRMSASLLWLPPVMQEVFDPIGPHRKVCA